MCFSVLLARNQYGIRCIKMQSTNIKNVGNMKEEKKVPRESGTHIGDLTHTQHSVLQTFMKRVFSGCSKNFNTFLKNIFLIGAQYE